MQQRTSWPSSFQVFICHLRPYSSSPFSPGPANGSLRLHILLWMEDAGSRCLASLPSAVTPYVSLCQRRNCSLPKRSRQLVAPRARAMGQPHANAACPCSLAILKCCSFRSDAVPDAGSLEPSDFTSDAAPAIRHEEPQAVWMHAQRTHPHMTTCRSGQLHGTRAPSL